MRYLSFWPFLVAVSADPLEDACFNARTLSSQSIRELRTVAVMVANSSFERLARSKTPGDFDGLLDGKSHLFSDVPGVCLDVFKDALATLSEAKMSSLVKKLVKRFENFILTSISALGFNIDDSNGDEEDVLILKSEWLSFIHPAYKLDRDKMQKLMHNLVKAVRFTSKVTINDSESYRLLRLLFDHKALDALRYRERNIAFSGIYNSDLEFPSLLIIIINYLIGLKGTVNWSSLEQLDEVFQLGHQALHKNDALNAIMMKLIAPGKSLLNGIHSEIISVFGGDGLSALTWLFISFAVIAALTLSVFVYRSFIKPPVITTKALVSF